MNDNINPFLFNSFNTRSSLNLNQNTSRENETRFLQRRRRLSIFDQVEPLNTSFTIHPQRIDSLERPFTNFRFIRENYNELYNETNVEDKNDLSENENINENIENKEDSGLIDFRTYPLNLDWTDVENENTPAFKILKDFGHFGLSLYTGLKDIFLDLSNLYIHEMFFQRIIHKLRESNYNKKCNFVLNIPPLKIIHKILYEKIFTEKDFKCIKLILDLHEYYLKSVDGPLFKNILEYLIPTAILFYSILTKNQFKILNEYFVKNCKFNIEMTTIHKNKKAYIKHYHNMKKKYSRISNNLCITKFIK